MLSLTTVGDIPKPNTKEETMFMIFQLVFSLMLFSSVLGYVANIVTNVSAARKEFQDSGRSHSDSGPEVDFVFVSSSNKLRCLFQSLHDFNARTKCIYIEVDDSGSEQTTLIGSVINALIGSVIKALIGPQHHRP
ncbi:unnamed protein product, partial [Cyprideis torosa]